MTDPAKLITYLTAKLNEETSVLGLVLVGSQARSEVYTASEYSDLEAYVVASDEDVAKVEDKLPQILEDFGKVEFYFKHAIGFVAVLEDLFRVELPVIKRSEMKGTFSRPKAQTIKVLFDKTDGELEKILKDRPGPIDAKKEFAGEFKSRVENFWYWQIIAVQYFKKGELYNTRAVLNIHASSFIKLCELLNDPNILLLETNKRVEKFLSEDQLANLRKITPAYKSEMIRVSLNEVMEIFPSIFGQIEEKYGYFYDKELEGKVKVKLLNILE